MKVRIGILEDEVLEQKITLEHVSRFFSTNDIEYEYFVSNNAEDFLKHDLTSVDIVLLDIIMDGEKNGFDVAKIIREKNNKVAIIFLTKTVQYAIKGYQVRAIDYMLKPLIYEDFSLKMTMFLKSLFNDERKEHVFKCKDKIIKIKEKNIKYIDIYKHYLTLYCVDGEYVTRGSMLEISKILSNNFSRCSSNCFINLMHLEEIRKDDAVVDGKLIKITAKYKKQFLKDLSLYLVNHD